jgi:hypothetical protein
LSAVAELKPARNPFAVDYYLRTAKKGIGTGIDDIFFNSRRHYHRFEYGTGFEGLAGVEISPNSK